MGLFSWFKKQTAKIPVVNTFGTTRFSTFDFSSKRASRQLDYQSWAYAATNAIAQEFSTIDIGLFKHDDKGNMEREFGHPSLQILRHVNDFMTSKDIFIRASSNIDLSGNEYWFVQKGIGNQPEAIFPLQPNFITPIPDEHNYVKGYSYRIGGQTVTLDKDFIVHFKTYNPVSDILGISTIAAARSAYDADFLAREYNQEFFLNGGNPGVVIEVEGNLTPEDKKRIREAWDQSNSGRRRRFKTIIAEGKTKIKQFSTTQKDMEFLEQRKFSRDEILSIFKVPKSILGQMEDVNRASAETAHFVFVSRTVRPRQLSFIETLNEFYLPMFEDTENMKFKLLNKIPEDRDRIIRFYTEGITHGWLSQNDIRRAEGLPEINGGETTYLPGNLFPVGEPEEKAISEISHKHAIADELVSRLVGCKERKQVEDMINKPKANTLGFEDSFEKMINDVFDDMRQGQDNIVDTLEISTQLETEGKALRKVYLDKLIDDFLIDNNSTDAQTVSNRSREGTS